MIANQEEKKEGNALTEEEKNKQRQEFL